MKLVIDKIKIDEEQRIRKDSGNLETLKASIEHVGLIHPILVNENNQLLAGYRRLTVCKALGWKEIEVTVLKTEGDRLKMLDIEAAENLHRKDFTQEELVEIERKRQEIIESLRKKSIFERFWFWLKKLFGITAGEIKDSAQENKPGKSEKTVPNSEKSTSSFETDQKKTEEIDIFQQRADKVIDPYGK